MKFPSKSLPYLAGDKFSNALRIKYEGDNTDAGSRSNLLTKLAAGKKVLHIGFADHLPLIEKKIKDNTWLHAQLAEVSELCLGVDIDGSAVRYCQEELEIENLYHHNIIEDAPIKEIMDEKWDIAILGEIIEHVSNPVLFLSSLREKYGEYIKKLVVTAPNAWELNNLINIRRCEEFINSDHRFWFTPYTLSKIASDAGLEVEELNFVNAFPENRFFRKFMQNRYPMLKEILVGVYTFK